ncbi:MAG: hypothetical protein HWE34_12515 [Methylocystaceae bacterium]|nr:hypothetical protein [Methylocystaceae bacterium]
MLHFDLNIPVIPAGQNVYMLHPGKNYHLFDRFKEYSCVSADLPGLDLLDGKSPALSERIDMQIRRARAMRDWLAMNAHDRKKNTYETDLDEFAKEDPRRFHNSYKETLIDLLWTIPAGTPIFVPSTSMLKKGFFCELGKASAPRVTFNGERSAKDFVYTGRPVVNIKQVDMRLVPPDVLEEKNRNSILTELDFESSEKMLRLFYGSFAIQGDLIQTEINIPSDVFRPADANIINGFTNYLEENLQRLENGVIDPADMLSSFFMAFDEAELRIHARLNSKGVVQVAAKTVAPYLLAFFLAIPEGLATEEIVRELANNNFQVSNSKCEADVETPRLIKERLFDIVSMFGEDQVIDICNRISELKARTGASVKAVLDHVDN